MDAQLVEGERAAQKGGLFPCHKIKSLHHGQFLIGVVEFTCQEVVISSCKPIKGPVPVV